MITLKGRPTETPDLCNVLFQIYTEDQQRINKTPGLIKSIHDDILSLQDSFKLFNTLLDNSSKNVDTLESHIIQTQKSVEKSEYDINQANNSHSIIIGATLGSLTGGTVGILLAPLIGTSAILISSGIGFLSGILYNY